MPEMDTIIDPSDRILVTGSAGFIGTRVVARLLEAGYRNIRCLIRSSSKVEKLREIIDSHNASSFVEVITGNLLSKEDCRAVAKQAAVVYHLAAGTGTKSFSDAFLNSVVTTRNLLDAAREGGALRRFVSLSSFAVYTNRNKSRTGILDESCPTEDHPESRGDAYCFAKVKQDELVIDYGNKYGIPYVLIRPAVVYGPGKDRIHGRVGLDSFGIFLHLGGSNAIPLTHVDNCAEAIALAGIRKGIDGEVFNIVDDDLPSSRQFLRMYKKHVRRFQSVYVPHAASYLLCLLWEKYSAWSQGQLPPIHNRREWSAYWKRTRYSNGKVKQMLGWSPRKPTRDGLMQYFASCRAREAHA